MPRKSNSPYTFHGAFKSKEEAKKKEKKVGGFIRQVTVRGQKRYSVITKH